MILSVEDFFREMPFEDDDFVVGRSPKTNHKEGDKSKVKDLLGNLEAPPSPTPTRASFMSAPEFIAYSAHRTGSSSTQEQHRLNGSTIHWTRRAPEITSQPTSRQREGSNLNTSRLKQFIHSSPLSPENIPLDCQSNQTSPRKASVLRISSASVVDSSFQPRIRVGPSTPRTNPLRHSIHLDGVYGSPLQGNNTGERRSLRKQHKQQRRLERNDSPEQSDLVVKTFSSPVKSPSWRRQRLNRQVLASISGVDDGSVQSPVVTSPTRSPLDGVHLLGSKHKSTVRPLSHTDEVMSPLDDIVHRTNHQAVCLAPPSKDTCAHLSRKKLLARNSMDSRSASPTKRSVARIQQTPTTPQSQRGLVSWQRCSSHSHLSLKGSAHGPISMGRKQRSIRSLGERVPSSRSTPDSDRSRVSVGASTSSPEKRRSRSKSGETSQLRYADATPTGTVRKRQSSSDVASPNSSSPPETVEPAKRRPMRVSSVVKSPRGNLDNQLKSNDRQSDILRSLKDLFLVDQQKLNLQIQPDDSKGLVMELGDR